jgi:predicted enzyme related to lactoylglutathione lyase
MRGRSKTAWWGVVLEAPDPDALGEFYARLLGWPVSASDDNGCAIQVPGTASYLSFNSSPGFARPAWPHAEGQQQMMMHVDIAVDELTAAVAAAVELGATVADCQPQDDVRVLFDPAGHPFCLYLDE